MGNYAIMSDELYHHGIKGQKWGVRRFQNPDGTRTAAGKKRYYENSNSKSNKVESENSSKSTSESVNKKQKLNSIFNHKISSSEQNGEKKGFKGLSPKQKKILIAVGVTAAVTAYAYYSYKAYNKDFPTFSDRERESNWNKLNNPFDAIKKITVPEDKSTTMSKVNPGFGKKGTTMNCTMCTTAYEMRRRGYDVKANYSTKGRTETDISLYYKNVTPLDWIKLSGSKENFNEEFEKMPNGSRGNLVALVGRFKTGHSMVWEKEDNKLIVRDCQTNKVYDSNNLFREKHSKGIINLGEYMSFLRTDNLEINKERIMDALIPAS